MSVMFTVGPQKPCHGLTMGRDLAQSCWMKCSAQGMNSPLISARRVTGDSKIVTTLKTLGSPVTLSQVQMYSSASCMWLILPPHDLPCSTGNPLVQDPAQLPCMTPTRAAGCGTESKGMDQRQTWWCSHGFAQVVWEG